MTQNEFQNPQMTQNEPFLHDSHEMLSSSMWRKGPPHTGPKLIKNACKKKDPKMTPKWSKMIPRWFQDDPMTPRWPQDDPKWPQNEFKMTQNEAQNDTKMTQNDPKMTPRWPKMTPRWAQDDPKMIQNERVSSAVAAAAASRSARQWGVSVEARQRPTLNSNLLKAYFGNCVLGNFVWAHIVPTFYFGYLRFD